MKTQKYSLMLFIILIVFNACSIEKKHASFGYHIEWRNNKFLAGNNTVVHKAKDKVIDTPIEIDLILESKANSVAINPVLNIDSKTALNENSPIINGKNSTSKRKEIPFYLAKNLLPSNNISESAEVLNAYILKKIPVAEEKSKNIKHSNINKPRDNDPKVNGFALAGFIFSLLFLVPGFIVLGTIFSIIGIKQIKRRPNYYSGMGYAIVGLAIPMTFVLMILIAIVLILLNPRGL